VSEHDSGQAAEPLKLLKWCAGQLHEMMFRDLAGAAEAGVAEIEVVGVHVLSSQTAPNPICAEIGFVVVNRSWWR